MTTENGASLSACECLDGGHDTGNGVCMCGGTIMDRSSATEPRCADEIAKGDRAQDVNENRCPVCGGLNPGDTTHTRCM